jgi:hypothetical protein
MAEETTEVMLTVDGLVYRAPAGVITGAELRAIPHPPIPPDRDLWLDLVDAPDQLVLDNVSVAVEEGLRLFTTPRTIMMGTTHSRVSGLVVTPFSHTFGKEVDP